MTYEVEKSKVENKKFFMEIDRFVRKGEVIIRFNFEDNKFIFTDLETAKNIINAIDEVAKELEPSCDIDISNFVARSVNDTNTNRVNDSLIHIYMKHEDLNDFIAIGINGSVYKIPIIKQTSNSTLFNHKDTALPILSMIDKMKEDILGDD